MAVQADQNNVFMIKETFIWPNRGGADKRAEVDKRLIAGYQHRQNYADKGKMQWFLVIEGNFALTVILHGTHRDYLEYMQTDPWFGLVNREVKIVVDANGLAERFKSAIANVNYANRVSDAPGMMGDLSISSLVPDMAHRLMDTDTNC